MHCIVVGAGICGLAASIALARGGHRVTVYERRPKGHVTGAGLVSQPSAATILTQWGLTSAMDDRGMIRYTHGEFRNGKTNESLGTRHDFRGPEFEGMIHARNTTREDILHVLADEALRLGVEIRYEVGIEDYDTDKPAVKTTVQEWESADLVVACDGIHSLATKHILGHDNAATPIKSSCFRLLVRTDEILKAHPNGHFAEKHRSDPTSIYFTNGFDGRMIVLWPARDASLQALDIIIPDNEGYARAEEWTVKSDKALLQSEFEDWHPLWHEIFEAGPNPYLYKICTREPLPSLHKGKLCVLGDSLHPMPPFFAQGGTQSVEDAGALEILFADVHNAAEVPARLQKLQQLRLPRASCLQLYSALRHDEDHEKRFADLQPRFKSLYGADEDVSHLNSYGDFLNWVFTYDVRDSAQKAVAAVS